MFADIAEIHTLQGLVEAGKDRLPLPGEGSTLERWAALANVAAQDVALVKLFEGHTDALAIRGELDAPRAPEGSRWGTWCAEPPQARVTVATEPGGRLRLDGTKAWCSGARQVTHAMVSCWDAEGAPRLAAIDLAQSQVQVMDGGWCAAGMQDAGTCNVRFEDATALWVSEAHAYVERPGFWQGSAGIAACWWGGAAGIAEMVAQSLAKSANPHALAHLGAIDVALARTAALLQCSALWIDRHPEQSALHIALRARAAVEDAAMEIIERAGRALGAGPLCRNEKLAKAMTDLPVFLRQSHAESDLESLGKYVLDADPLARRWHL